MTFLKQKLEKRKQLGNLRMLTTESGLVDFASNDYLGIAKIPHETPQWGHGSTGSRLLTGNTLYAEQLEKKIASFHGFEAGVLFSCGYMANLGLISAIASEKDTFIFDSHIHASMHDGIKLSKSKAYPFRHNDVNHLEIRLKQNIGHGERFVCIESIYSTDGSMAPLKEIQSVVEAYDAHLIVDEAHAVGVFGPQGSGRAQMAFAKVVTFGKAIGAQGAIVLGSNLLKHVLINFAHSYIYTTALPFQNLFHIQRSYNLFPFMDQERAHLFTLIHHMQGMTGSFSPIQPILISGNAQALAKSQLLKKMGFDVRALLSPTVRRGREMLRICLHSFNSFDELQKLTEVLC